MRNLYEVIDQMLDVIPNKELVLKTELKGIQNSLLYAAPELHPFWWNECAELFNHHIEDIDEEWKIKLERIFAGE